MSGREVKRLPRPVLLQCCCTSLAQSTKTGDDGQDDQKHDSCDVLSSLHRRQLNQFLRVGQPHNRRQFLKNIVCFQTHKRADANAWPAYHRRLIHCLRVGSATPSQTIFENKSCALKHTTVIHSFFEPHKTVHSNISSFKLGEMSVFFSLSLVHKS